MSAQMKLIRSEVLATQASGAWAHEAYAATGLTASAANTVPFPEPLTRVPFYAFAIPVGNGAAGALVSLDTSQGVAGPDGGFTGGKLGVDKNNVYLYIGNATECLIAVVW